MVVNGRHQEHPLAGQLEEADLNDHRQGFHDKEAADDRHDDLVFGGDRHRADQAAKRQRSGVTHEDGGWRCVEP
ncbi:hypothetical protein D3C71_1939640 [compost metagenome]